MHDPMTVAFEIRRPWPERSPMPAAGHQSTRWRIRLHHACSPTCADDPPHRDGAFPWWRPSSYSAFWRLGGRDYYWPPIVVMWHREPGGRDGLTVCSTQVRQRNGAWRFSRGWKWHLHHWRLQVPPLQRLRRRLLTRCEWCGDRSTKTDPVNVSHSWDRRGGRWWHGERGLFHVDCSGIENAHTMCLCVQPALGHGSYGRCAHCARFRPYGVTTERLLRAKELASIPHGERRRIGE